MSKPKTTMSRLQASEYFSPYSRAGAPGVAHTDATSDHYAQLRSKALATLEAMGYEKETMAERGVTWGDDQDPFGHVAHSQYIHFFSLGWHRVLENYQAFMSNEDYEKMIHGQHVIPVVSKYEVRNKRQVKYPDALIIAYRQDLIEPTRNNGTSCLFSLQQQAIVAEATGTVTFIDAKTGRPTDIRKAGDGWLRFYEGFTKKAEVAKALKEKWDAEHKKTKAKI